MYYYRKMFSKRKHRKIKHRRQLSDLERNKVLQDKHKHKSNSKWKIFRVNPSLNDETSTHPVLKDNKNGNLNNISNKYIMSSNNNISSNKFVNDHTKKKGHHKSKWKKFTKPLGTGAKGIGGFINKNSTNLTGGVNNLLSNPLMPIALGVGGVVVVMVLLNK